MSDDEEELVDLPDFANAANRALYADLKDAERALAATEEELAETGERVSVMEGHLGSVVAERQNTQRLVDAKAKEVETEDHLKQLADRELGRFSSELSKLQRECADLTDKAPRSPTLRSHSQRGRRHPAPESRAHPRSAARGGGGGKRRRCGMGMGEHSAERRRRLPAAQATAAQTQIFKGNERMDAFKLQMNWKQEAHHAPEPAAPRRPARRRLPSPKAPAAALAPRTSRPARPSACRSSSSGRSRRARKRRTTSPCSSTQRRACVASRERRRGEAEEEGRGAALREGGPPTSSPLWRQADESRLKSLNLQLEKTLAQARAALGADSRREPPPLEPSPPATRARRWRSGRRSWRRR